MYIMYCILLSFPLFHWFWDSPYPWTTHSSLPEMRRHLPLSWEIQPVAFIALGWYIAPEGIPRPRGSNHWPSYINFNQEDTASFWRGENCSRFPLQNLDKVEKKKKRSAATKTTLTTERKVTFSKSSVNHKVVIYRPYTRGLDQYWHFYDTVCLHSL